jgi:hypothetical protein
MPQAISERKIYAPSWLSKFMRSDLLVIYFPMAMFFTSLTLIDSFNAFSITPGMLGAASLIIAAYKHEKESQTPVWFNKQLYRLTAGSIFLFLTLGYAIL